MRATLVDVPIGIEMMQGELSLENAKVTHLHRVHTCLCLHTTPQLLTFSYSIPPPLEGPGL